MEASQKTPSVKRSINRPQIIGVEQFRQNLRATLETLKKDRQILYLVKRGKKEAVVMDVKTFDEIIDRIELLEDSLALHKMDQLDESEFIELDEVTGE